jgi:hypothetical protein
MTNRLVLVAILSCIAAGISGVATSAATPPAEEAAAVAAPDFLFGTPACLLAAKNPGPPNPTQQSCSAQVTCWDSSIISCSYGGSGSCTSVDSNCPGQPGYVSCPGTTTYCPDCPEDPCENNAPACTVGCSFNADCNAVCCEGGLCVNGGCSPKPYIKFCVCLN